MGTQSTGKSRRLYRKLLEKIIRVAAKLKTRQLLLNLQGAAMCIDNIEEKLFNLQNKIKELEKNKVETVIKELLEIEAFKESSFKLLSKYVLYTKKYKHPKLFSYTDSLYSDNIELHFAGDELYIRFNTFDDLLNFVNKNKIKINSNSLLNQLNQLKAEVSELEDNLNELGINTL